MNYIAFLQSLRIGRNKIDMLELKHLFLSLGFKNVQTFYQNGNVYFESDKDEIDLRKMIEREIIIRYRCAIPVVLRSKDSFKQIISNCPFTSKEIKDAEMVSGRGLFVAFLKDKPNDISLLDDYNDKNDEFTLIGREIYILINKGHVRFSNLINNLTQVDIHATLRDWLTIKKIHKKLTTKA